MIKKKLAISQYNLAKQKVKEINDEIMWLKELNLSL